MEERLKYLVHDALKGEWSIVKAKGGMTKNS